MNNKFAATDDSEKNDNKDEKDFFHGPSIGLLFVIVWLLIIFIGLAVWVHFGNFALFYPFIAYLVLMVYLARKNLRFVLGALIIPFVLIIALMAIGPLIGNPFCSGFACINMSHISLDLEGLPSLSNYEVKIVNLSGEASILVCDSSGQEVTSLPTQHFLPAGCSKSGASFWASDPRPEVVTVIVTVNNKQFSERFHLEYKPLDCYECDEARIKMAVSTTWWDRNKMTVVYVSVAVLPLAAAMIFLICRKYFSTDRMISISNKED
jgi:hypothetical protein